MKVFQILWTGRLNDIKELRTFLILQYISALSIKRVYGSLSIITDRRGKNILKELGMPYDNYIINSKLENRKEEYFSAAKVEAIKSIVDFNENFLFLDCDVFITEKINTKFKNIVQIDEGMSPNTWGLYQYCKRIGVNFTQKFDENNIRMLNMGVFRSSKNIVYQYYDSFFENLNKNLRFLNNYKHPINFMFPFTILLEQSLIYEVFKKNKMLEEVYQAYDINKPLLNKYPFLLPCPRAMDFDHLTQVIDYSNAPKFDPWFDTPANIEKIDQTKFVHLAMHKNNNNIIKEVENWGFVNFPSEMKQFMKKLEKILE